MFTNLSSLAIITRLLCLIFVVFMFVVFMFVVFMFAVFMFVNFMFVNLLVLTGAMSEVGSSLTTLEEMLAELQ